MKYRLFARKGETKDCCEFILANEDLKDVYIQAILYAIDNKKYEIKLINETKTIIEKAPSRGFNVEIDMPNITLLKDYHMGFSKSLIKIRLTDEAKNRFTEISDKGLERHILESSFKWSSIENLNIEDIAWLLNKNCYITPSIQPK